jgi:hypothetical protein
MAEKKKAKVVVRKSSTTSKSAKEAAYGKSEYEYKKATKPEKGSETYEYGDKKTRNTKFYDSGHDQRVGTMAKTLKDLGKAKEKNLTNKEARMMYEANDPKQKGKDFSRVTVSKVNEEAYNRVMKRAKDSGLSAADAKKAIESAIRTTSAGLKSDRDKVAMRFKMQETKKKIAAQNKIKRGY